MWLVLAIVAMLCWSGSDFFSKLGSKPSDKYSHWKMVIAVGVVMGIHAFYEMATGTKVTMQDIIYYMPASSMYILSMIFGYVSLRYIELSVSSPICNSSGAIAAILCFLVLGQTVDSLSTIGIVIVSAGVIFLGIAEYTEDDEAKMKRQLKANRKYTKSVLAILLPILYCIIDALGTFFDAVILEEGNTFMTNVFHYLDEDVANVAYELTFLFMAVVAFIYVFVIKKQKLSALSFKEEGPKGLGAICETAGQFAYVYALAANSVGAAPIICAYCVVSSVWSSIFLKERLSWKHYASLVAVVGGIIIMGVAESLAEL
ncbi:MAG: DMT family transporter [Ruminococcaceae bacterium]|nr:DMT family transporter [Oscillospiraceae bacterium]